VQERFPTPAAIALVAFGGATALVIAATGSLLLAIPAGVLALAVALLALRDRVGTTDPGRRRFLAALGAVGLALVAGGAGLGRGLHRLLAPDPRPALDEMARQLGAEHLELIRRAYHPERSGDLQLVVTPFSSSNYAPESLSLVPNDPRSSHAVVWMYAERVPIAVYAPGIVVPGDSTERVTLADLAPTTAALMGFDGFSSHDGRLLPGIQPPIKPPRVIVTFVIDGGGWNVLSTWPDAWPNMKRIFRGGATYRDAIVGSFPAVTASSHATIGTGAFPRTHGITGHNVRHDGRPEKAWGIPGQADPSFLLVPTLADAWTEATKDRAWAGEIGYQVWHMGMLGHGGRPLGELPVGTYWAEDAGGGWKPHNPDLYRMPHEWPGIERLAELEADFPPLPASPFDPDGKKAKCCFPPVIRYQGDLIEAAFDSEPIGEGDATSLLYVNYKAPDYAGHVYNMAEPHTELALGAVDEQLGRVAALLEERYGSGSFALIVCADHGQCPPIDASGGVRIDPIQLDLDLKAEFGRGIVTLVESVVPSEIYLSKQGLFDAGVSMEEIAAFLAQYRYGDNVGPYVRDDVIVEDRLGHRQFAAVLPTSFLAELADADLSTYGEGIYTEGAVDPGLPEITW